MGFTDAIRSGFQNYANFAGRAGRSEYWFWVLFNVIVSIVASIVDSIIFGGGNGFGPIEAIASLALLLPSIAVGVRRLHDTDKSGWYLLAGLIPVLGWIYLIYLYIKPGTPGPNRFGPPPPQTAVAATA